MIAIISDIHGNLPALNAVLQQIEALGCSRIICLGDVVGYYAQPEECIDSLIEKNVIHILGNHDSYLLKDEGCTRSKLVNEIISYHKTLVRDDQIEWLARASVCHIEGNNYFTHGGWKDFQEQYLYNVREKDLPARSSNFFSGHTHVQILSKIGAKTYCNPGAVGQPRDGDSRAAFATLNQGDIQLHRVPYDIDQTCRAMKMAGFPTRYYENLYIGAQIGGRIDKVRIETLEHDG